MRIHVRHETVYAYASPPKYVIQKLRLSPRSHEGQYVRRWRIEVDQDCRLIETSDAFGNIVHSFTLHDHFDELKIAVEGEIETEETAGVVRREAASDCLLLHLDRGHAAKLPRLAYPRDMQELTGIQHVEWTPILVHDVVADGTIAGTLHVHLARVEDG